MTPSMISQTTHLWLQATQAPHLCKQLRTEQGQLVAPATAVEGT